QVIGVADPSMAEKMAQVLARLGSTHALVVHGVDGLDEISLDGPTRVWEMQNGTVSEMSVSPDDVGMETSPMSAIQAHGVEESARILRDVLAGKTGPARDIVLFNAAAALLAADRVSSLAEGVGVAAEAIDSGKALAGMESFVKLSQSLE
ncbi:MAG: anthranilate phosphoribosyltransferase, partial [Chloroflexi bacterium]|nr:anthranilate phosphoribosyltransferase [Chloroflexota bacterium]